MWINVHICIPYIDFSFLFPGLLLSLIHLLLLLFLLRLQLLDWVNSFLALFSFLPPPPHPNPSLAHPPPLSPMLMRGIPGQCERSRLRSERPRNM